jgi:hypothetical protein
VSTAFLHATLPDSEFVLVEPPPSLRRPGWLWRRLKADPQIFAHEGGALLTMHANGILLAESGVRMETREKELSEDMKIEWGHVLDRQWRKYLGCEGQRTSDGEYQVRIPGGHWKSILDIADMAKCEALLTPSEVNTENTGDNAEPSVDRQKQFQNILGKEIWTLGFEKVNEVNVFSDSNWADGSMRHSTSGGCIFVHGCLIAPWARTQPSIALSSCGAEVVALRGREEGDLGREIPKPPYVANAIGKQLIFYDMRAVDLKGLQLTIDFSVMSVDRPILSAEQLARDGYKVTLDNTSNLIGHQFAPCATR